MTTEQRELLADKIVAHFQPSWQSAKREMIGMIGEVLNPKPKRRADVVAEQMLWVGVHNGHDHLFLRYGDRTAALINSRECEPDRSGLGLHLEFCRNIIADVIDAEIKRERQECVKAIADFAPMVHGEFE
jgi:hypothetical protein